MKILVPIDGLECSFRALEFALEFAERYDASLHVVHFSDAETDATEQIVARASEVVEAAGVDDEPELVEADLGVQTSDNAGKQILQMVDEGGYDHVVMGHHGSSRVERAILGSAAETVVRGDVVPVTIVP